MLKAIAGLLVVTAIAVTLIPVSASAGAHRTCTMVDGHRQCHRWAC